MVSELRPTDRAQTRRALLGAGAGGLIAWLAGAIGGPARTLAAHLPGFGHPNDAGASNTSLTTSSTGTALLVTQNGTGTALRGSAVGPGSIAGFFTANNGTGISGVTGNAGKYGVYGGNDADTSGNGAAIRASGQHNHGLVATTINPDASAVRGITSGVGGGEGIYGAGPVGVRGTGTEAGVWGQCPAAVGVEGHSASGYGVLGQAFTGLGVWGSSGSGVGVLATSTLNDGLQGLIARDYKAGVVGANPNNLGWAGYFEGHVRITGILDNAAAVSRIDHPLDPANRTLAHTFVGSPEMKNVYDGTVTLDAGGQATVSLPAYFEALNTSVHYQLTAIGAAAPDLHVAAKVNKNRFTIAGGQPGMEVSWQVTGVRQDAYATANPIKVEAAKPAERRGRYLNPLAHGQPESKGWKDLSAPLEPLEVPAP